MAAYFPDGGNITYFNGGSFYDIAFWSIRGECVFVSVHTIDMCHGCRLNSFKFCARNFIFV